MRISHLRTAERKSLRKDYEAWKNIMEHDRMLEKELNVSSTEELTV